MSRAYIFARVGRRSGAHAPLCGSFMRPLRAGGMAYTKQAARLHAAAASQAPRPARADWPAALARPAGTPRCARIPGDSTQRKRSARARARAGQSNDAFFRLAKAGRAAHLVDGVAAFEARHVRLASGRRLPADVVVAALGLRFQASPACLAGLGVGAPRGRSSLGPCPALVGSFERKRSRAATRAFWREALSTLGTRAGRACVVACMRAAEHLALKMSSPVLALRPARARRLQGPAQLCVPGRERAHRHRAGRHLRLRARGPAQAVRHVPARVRRLHGRPHQGAAAGKSGRSRKRQRPTRRSFRSCHALLGREGCGTSR